MRILFFNRVAAPLEGGMNQYVMDVAARLRAAGEEVAMVHGREPKSQFRGTGYVFDHIDRSNASETDVRSRLNAVVEDFAPDVIQLHGTENLALHKWLAERAPTVRFMHSHRYYCSGTEMTWTVPRRICERRHSKLCVLCHVFRGCGSPSPLENLRQYRTVSASLHSLRYLRGIQVASPVLRANLIRNRVPESKIELIPLYAPAPQAERRPHATGRRMILHVGGMLHRKGVWLMIHGLKHLPEDVEIVFAGGGDQQEAATDYVRRNRLGERVRIMGELTPAEWSVLYHQASLVVMPSRWNEPLGLGGIQAMAHGKPVVAFRSEGISEWLRHEQNGVLVDFNDSREFLGSVRDLLSRPARLAEMGRKGQDIWQREYRPEIHVQRLREYYRRVVETSQNPQPKDTARSA